MGIFQRTEQTTGRDYGGAQTTTERVVTTPIGWAALALVALAALVILVIVLGFGWNAYNRYQQRANRNQARQQALYDAHNQSTINSIKISQTQQLVKVAEQQARIRYETAVGIRRAQDEISSTLTPLYVQFEMTDALKQIAQSGKNNTVVYIPTGDSGIPLVSTNDPTQVGK